MPIQTVVASIDAAGVAAAAAPAPAKGRSAQGRRRARCQSGSAETRASASSAGRASRSRAPQPKPQEAPAGERRQGSQLAAGPPHRSREQYRPLAGARHWRRRPRQQAGHSRRYGRRRAARPAPAPRAPRRPLLRRRRRPLLRRVLETAVPREKMYFGHYEVQPMSIMRQKIAEHMVLSKRVSPHVYSVEEVDVTAIAALRAKIEGQVRAGVRHQADLHALLHSRRGRSPARLSRP